MAATNQQLESVRTQLEAKENDAATQRQQQELVSKYSERLRNLQAEIKTLKKRQREYAQMERINRERCSEIGRLQSQVIGRYTHCFIAWYTACYSSCRARCVESRLGRGAEPGA